MLRPPTDDPSRDARPSGRPGVVALPVAALAAVLVLSVALTARGGTADGQRQVALPAASAHATGHPYDAHDPYDPYDAHDPYDARDTHGAVSGRGPLGAPATPGTGGVGGTGDTPDGRPARHSSAPREETTPRPPRTGGQRPAPAAPVTPAGAAASPPGKAAATPGSRRGAAPPDDLAPYEALRVGDCFDIDRGAPGTVVRRACDTPHDAEAVARLTLTGRYADDDAVREAAAVRCRAPLRAEAAEQPLGTRWTTFVQYPYRTSYLLGADTVVCSLAVPSASGRKLTEPLR